VLLAADQCREPCDVGLRFLRKWSTGGQMQLVPRRPGVVGRKSSLRSEAVDHLAEVRSPGRDVVSGVQGIVAEFVPDALIDPGW